MWHCPLNCCEMVDHMLEEVNAGKVNYKRNEKSALQGMTILKEISFVDFAVRTFLEWASLLLLWALFC